MNEKPRLTCVCGVSRFMCVCACVSGLWKRSKFIEVFGAHPALPFGEDIFGGFTTLNKVSLEHLYLHLRACVRACVRQQSAIF
jgi:hypothetical protein